MRKLGFISKVNLGFTLQIVLLLILTSVVLRILHYVKEETALLGKFNARYGVLSQAELDLQDRLRFFQTSLESPARELFEKTRSKQTLLSGDEELLDLARQQAHLDRQDSELDALIRSLNEGRARLAAAEQKAAAGALEEISGEVIPALAGLIDTLQKLRNRLEQGSVKSRDSLFGLCIFMQWAVGWTAIIGSAIGLAIMFLVLQPVLRQIRKVIQTLTRNSEHALAASSEMAGASQDIANASGHNASSLEEISATVREMAATSRETAAATQHVTGVLSQTRDAAERSREAIARMDQAIGSIHAASSETANIIKTIDEIAFQTNLLALNAAVEAARAGEAGRGFAVVADEVRNLARRSAESSGSTSELIQEAQRSAEHGVAVAREVQEFTRGIIDSVIEVTDLMRSAAEANHAQAQGIEQVSATVEHMGSTVQDTAANAGQLVASGNQLRDQAGELDNVVHTLESIVGGRSPDRGPTSDFRAADARGLPARLKDRVTV